MSDEPQLKCSFCGREDDFLHSVTSQLEKVAICHECVDVGKMIMDRVRSDKFVRDRIAQLETELAEARKLRRVVIPDGFDIDWEGGIDPVTTSFHKDFTPQHTKGDYLSFGKVIAAFAGTNCIPVDREGNEIK